MAPEKVARDGTGTEPGRQRRRAGIAPKRGLHRWTCQIRLFRSVGKSPIRVPGR